MTTHCSTQTLTKARALPCETAPGTNKASVCLHHRPKRVLLWRDDRELFEPDPFPNFVIRLESRRRLSLHLLRRRRGRPCGRWTTRQGQTEPNIASLRLASPRKSGWRWIRCPKLFCSSGVLRVFWAFGVFWAFLFVFSGLLVVFVCVSCACEEKKSGKEIGKRDMKIHFWTNGSSYFVISKRVRYYLVNKASFVIIAALSYASLSMLHFQTDPAFKELTNLSIFWWLFADRPSRFLRCRSSLTWLC